MCMKQKLKILSLLLLCSFSVSWLQGQQGIFVTGGNPSGSGGSVTYTVGQVAWNTYSETSGSVAQGVQQPWEISIVTAIGNTEDISLEMNVYPNPASGSFKLFVGSPENKNLRFRLYDMSGLLLQDKKIDSEETEIFIRDLSSSLYFLKVFNNKQEVKVFKIVKK